MVDFTVLHRISVGQTLMEINQVPCRHLRTFRTSTFLRQCNIQENMLSGLRLNLLNSILSKKGESGHFCSLRHLRRK